MTTGITRTFALGLVATVSLAMTPAPTAETWHVDPNHTEVGFSVKHFFTPVTGKFENFDVDLRYDPQQPAASSVTVVVEVSSVNTNNERRDNHLLSADFFEAMQHPEMTFRSESVRRTGPSTLVATGPLTIKGVTRTVELPIEVLGIKDIPEPMQEMLGGATRVASFRATTTLDRGDFGVGVGDWAAALVVGHEVTIDVTAEAALRD